MPCKVTEECRPYGLHETTCMITRRSKSVTRTSCKAEENLRTLTGIVSAHRTEQAIKHSVGLMFSLDKRSLIIARSQKYI